MFPLPDAFSAGLYTFAAFDSKLPGDYFAAYLNSLVAHLSLRFLNFFKTQIYAKGCNNLLIQSTVEVRNSQVNKVEQITQPSFIKLVRPRRVQGLK